MKRCHVTAVHSETIPANAKENSNSQMKEEKLSKGTLGPKGPKRRNIPDEGLSMALSIIFGTADITINIGTDKMIKGMKVISKTAFKFLMICKTECEKSFQACMTITFLNYVLKIPPA